MLRRRSQATARSTSPEQRSQSLSLSRQQSRLDKIEGDVAELRRMDAGSLRKQVTQLMKQASELQAQVAVLAECLAVAGVVNEETYLAKLHRRRFQALKVSYPFLSDVSLESVFSAAGIPLVVGLYTGIPAIGSAAVASQVLHGAGLSALPILRELSSVYIYVVGGKSEESSMLDSAARFSPAAQTWEEIPQFHLARVGSGCGVIDGKLYICGGKTEHGAAMKSMERFDPRAGIWEQLPPMMVARWGLSATVLAGKFYACGGCGDFMRASNATERFDPVGVWEANPPMIEHRGWAVSGHAGGFLFVCGGRCGEHLLSSVERFDPSRGSWEAAPHMLTPRSGASAASVRDRVFVCGGRSCVHILRSVECFSAESNSWENIQSMSTSRFCAAACSVAGRIYIFGGYGVNAGVGQYLDSGEMFSPANSRWLDIPRMPTRRSYLAASVVLL